MERRINVPPISLRDCFANLTFVWVRLADLNSPDHIRNQRVIVSPNFVLLIRTLFTHGTSSLETLPVRTS